MEIPGLSLGTAVVSRCVRFAPVRNSPDISMLCSCPLWSTGALPNIAHTVGPELKKQPLSGALLITVVEEESASSGNSTLQPGHTISIHSIFPRTDHTACSTTRRLCAQKKEPETFGNCTNNYHRSQSVLPHLWGKGKWVLKRKAQYILHYQLQRNKQKLKEKSSIPKESKETMKRPV